MTSIVCNVKDIQEGGRRWLEQTLGEPLRDDQQVWIEISPPRQPPMTTRKM